MPMETQDSSCSAGSSHGSVCVYQRFFDLLFPTGKNIEGKLFDVASAKINAINTLPRTEDGFPLVPGVQVWKIDCDEDGKPYDDAHIETGTVWSLTATIPVMVDVKFSDGVRNLNVGAFSNEAALRKAKGLT